MSTNLLFQQPVDYPLVTGTATQVVTTAEAKLALRIDSSVTTEDTFIARLISSATNYFEMVTGRDLITKSYKCYLDNFPSCDGVGGYYSYGSAGTFYDNGILLLKSKLQTITSIEYYLSGVLTTWSSANYYNTDENDYAAIYLVDGVSWPTTIDTRKQAVKITFTAGYGSAASSVPDDFKQLITEMVVYLYENRGDCGGNCNKLPTDLLGRLMARRIVYV